MSKTSDSTSLRIKSRLIIALLIAGFLGTTSYANFSSAAAKVKATPTPASTSQPPADLATQVPAPATTQGDVGDSSLGEHQLAILICVVGLLALGMQFLLLRRVPKLKAEDSLRTFGVGLIILGTLFFIAAGFSSQQIAPALGLFGIIAGYLLGRTEKQKEDDKHA
jgi:drug/metabolite transporter (DMT)-like permease